MDFRSPFPHRGIFLQPRHIREGLGCDPIDRTDFEDPPWKASSYLGSRKGMEWGLREQDRMGGEVTEIDM